MASPRPVRASAPGRVNLIGEHTDYNGGFVLPAAIPQRTSVELRPRPDAAVDVWSANFNERRAYVLGEEARRGSWVDYVQGITSILAAAGHRLGGFSLRIESAVPVGSGLSSSAALEIAVLRALRDAFDLAIDDVEMARLGQRVENVFVGAPVGIMDQMACALADDTHALFLDARTLEYERVAIPDAAALLVIDSGVAHNHAAGDYRTRRAECERAAALLDVPQLRDASAADLARIEALPEPLRRRARHVVTENARVLEAVAALRAGDLRAAGALFAASHASMRDDFVVSVPEVDLLVSIAQRQPGVHGARLTGGGFGGAIVALADRGSGRATADRIAAEYRTRSGRTATVLVPTLVG
ncbi:MAG TPA: galactokinase [Vicinamibacterales bacterium]|nr:galactokinase [Vicinamibacterales bacterium]